MFTDVAGFTARMEASESDALRILGIQRRIIDKLLPASGGRLVKEMGDGMLCVFPGPAGAVRCARALQSELAGVDFRVRIGIHWGEVLLSGDDVFGDTVNVASRLERMSAPGGILVSGELLSGWGAGRRPRTESLGMVRLRGLGRLVDVHAVKGTADCPLETASPVPFEEMPRPDRGLSIPSLAVIPLENLGDEKDRFYCHSITADLVADLTRAGLIRVIPMAEAARAGEAEKDSDAIACALRVRFVARGTLFRETGVFNIAVELYDAEAGRIAWADTWQDDWLELPSIKGKLADGLLKAVGIEPSRFAGMSGSETDKARAYEIYLEGWDAYRLRQRTADIERARGLLERSLELDPELVAARVILGNTYRDAGEYDRASAIYAQALETATEKRDAPRQVRILLETGTLRLRTSLFREAREDFLRALKLSRSIGDREGECRALNNLGLVEWNMGNYGTSLTRHEASLAIASELSSSYQVASSHCNMGLVRWSMGDDEKALEHYSTALGILVSINSLSGQMEVLKNMANVHHRAGAYEKALELSGRCLQITRELGDRANQCRALNNIGNVLLHTGMIEKSSALYAEALGLARALEDRFLEGIVLTNTGMMEMAAGRSAEAIGHYEAALSICRTIGDSEGEAVALSQLGEACLAEGRAKEAVSHLHSALAIMDSMGAEPRKAEIRCWLSLAILACEDGAAAIPKVLELAGRAEREISRFSYDRPSKLHLLAKVYGAVSETAGVEESVAAEARRKRESLVERAHESLLAAAARIGDREMRESFLHRVEGNAAILREIRER